MSSPSTFGTENRPLIARLRGGQQEALVTALGQASQHSSPSQTVAGTKTHRLHPARCSHMRRTPLIGDVRGAPVEILTFKRIE
jgi:hypothetical protein